MKLWDFPRSGPQRHFPKTLRLFWFIYCCFQEMRIKQISMLAFFSNFDTISLLNMSFHYFSEGISHMRKKPTALAEAIQPANRSPNSITLILFTINNVGFFSIIPAWIILNSFFYYFNKNRCQDELEKASLKNSQLSATCLCWKATDKESQILKNVGSLRDVLMAIIDAESNSSVVA